MSFVSQQNKQRRCVPPEHAVGRVVGHVGQNIAYLDAARNLIGGESLYVTIVGMLLSAGQAGYPADNVRMQTFSHQIGDGAAATLHGIVQPGYLRRDVQLFVGPLVPVSVVYPVGNVSTMSDVWRDPVVSELARVQRGGHERDNFLD